MLSNLLEGNLAILANARWPTHLVDRKANGNVVEKRVGGEFNLPSTCQLQPT